MATRSISIELLAKVQGFVSGLKTAQQAAKDFSSRTAEFARENEQHMDRVGKAGALVGGGIVAGVGLAVKSFADFDKAMSEVQASTHETEGNMAALREAAIKAGADTAFSASEAAKGIDELAKAGVDTKDILGGGLNGALSLAAAGSLGVGDSAEIAATALTQFKLSGKDIPHVADLLAAGAGKAQGSVEDIGGALKQSGLVASQFGLSIEDTTGTLAAFASAGLVGSDSGTSLKTMLLKLASPSKEAADMMSELGIAAYDSTGKFVGVTDLAGQLHDKLGGLTQAQRDSTLATIFGTDAIRGANVLYEQGAQGIGDWITKVNDAGFAADTARIKQDNLAGDLEKLGGSFDSILIQSGSGVNDVLRGLVQGLEGVVDAVGKVPGPVLGAATGFAAVLGGAGLLAGGLITVIPKIAETKAALEVLAPAGSKANTALSKTGKFAAGAAAGLAAVAAAATLAAPAMDKILAPTGETADSLKLFAGQAAQGAIGADTLNKSFQDLVQHRDGVSDFQTAIEGVADPGLWGNIDNIATGTIGVLSLGMVNLKSTSEEARARFGKMGEQLASLDAGKASESFKSMAQHTNGSTESLSRLLDYMPEYRTKLEEQAKASGQATDDQSLLNLAMGKIPAAAQAAQAATDPAAQSIEDVGTAAEQAAKQASDLVDSLLNVNNANLNAADAQLGFDQAVADAAKNLGNAGAGVDYLDEKTGAFNQTAADNLEMLNGIAAQGNKVAQSVFDQTGKYSEFKSSLEDSRQSLFDVAKAYYPTEQAAWAYVDSVMAIPPEMKTVVDITDNNSIQGVSQNLLLLHDAIQKTPDKTVIIKEPMSPEIRKGLEGLGYIVKTLPDGTIQVTETGTTATGQKIDATARKERIATITATAQTGVAEAQLNETARPRTSTVIQEILQRFRSENAPDPVGTGTVLAPKKKRAGGGPVFGPGSGTSDDIPAMLSNGEHVWTAQEVEQAGGQGAMYRMRQLAKAGLLPKFASGGAADKATARRDFWIDYQRDSRRGNGYRSVASSLSNAYSFADRLTSLADSGNVSAASIRNLYTAAGKGEGALRTLHARADKLSTALEKARDKVTSLSQTRDKIRGSLNDEFSIGDAMKNTSPFKAVTLQGIQGAANAVLARIRTFAGKLNKLRAMGYSGAVLEEIAGLGSTEGMVAADALLKGSKADVKNLNGVYGSIDSASKAAGTYVTDAMYKGGINAANGLVKGLQSQEKAIQQQMMNIGLGMERALKAALGIKSPSRKAAAIGNNFVGTLANRLEAGKSPIAKHAAALGDAMSVAPKGYTPATTYRPATIATNQGGLTVYVTNPFTGAEVQAIVKDTSTGVARSEIASADATSQYTRTGGR
ncbi:tail length tape measure protein [Arthrobacter phage Seahorse]|uniref:Tape measure protein n=1 Tax=Arthrobacter phage Seahorse TaxID=2419611 RepID=A0A3G3M4U2_9CAUD|nr:tail length tape measure protein [Arthrobacter phage Seahorse]AYR01520.1 tape measure protein [Arthrobacter phage Seahorse]